MVFSFFHLIRLARLPSLLHFEWTTKIMRLFCSTSLSFSCVSLVSDHSFFIAVRAYFYNDLRDFHCSGTQVIVLSTKQVALRVT